MAEKRERTRVSRKWKRIIAVVLSIVMIVTMLPVIPNGKEAEAATIPVIQDSVNAVNYATILGRATDFGIVAEEFEQQNHMETTIATNNFINVGPINNDVDFINGTAQFLFGGVEAGSKIRFGVAKSAATGSRVDTFNIEAVESVFEGFTDPYKSGEQGNFVLDTAFIDSDVDVVTIVNDSTKANINSILKNTTERSNEISKKAKNDSYRLNYREYISYNGEANCTLDLNDPAFVNKVVYINVDKNLLKYMQKTEGIRIIKDSTTIVVYNIEDEAVDENATLDLQKYAVSVDGGNNWLKSSSASGGGKLNLDGNLNSDIDKELCQKFIYNIRTDNDVKIHIGAATYIIPFSKNVDVAESSAGWLVVGDGNTDTISRATNSAGEWHYIYQGGNQEVNRDGIGQIHFAARKAFTEQYNGADTVEDKTVYTDKDKYTFEWYEVNDDTYTVTGPGGKKTVKNQATNTIKFPTLTFYSSDPRVEIERKIVTQYTDTTQYVYYAAKDEEHNRQYITFDEQSELIEALNDKPGDVKITLKYENATPNYGNINFIVTDKNGVTHELPRYTFPNGFEYNEYIVTPESGTYELTGEWLKTKLNVSDFSNLVIDGYNGLSFVTGWQETSYSYKKKESVVNKTTKYVNLTPAEKKYLVTEGNPKDFYYVVKEKDAGKVNADGIENSRGEIHIHLRVVNTNGVLSYYVDSETLLDDGTRYAANGAYKGDGSESVKMSGIEFTLGAFFNKIKKGTVTVEKKVTGDTDPADTEFTLVITAKDSNNDPVTGEFYATGLTGDKIEFDSEGKASITIKKDESVTIDGLPVGTNIVVTEPTVPEDYTLTTAEDKLKATTSLTSTPVITVTNKYTAVEPVTITPEVTKKLLDADNKEVALTADAFSFKIEGKGDDNNYSDTAKNNEEGKVTFSPLSFSKTGTYQYTISEEQGTDDKIEYSKETYTYTVVVIKNEGKLAAAGVYTDTNDQQATPLFTNKKKPEKYDVAISKTDLNGTALEGAIIVLKDKDKNTIETWTSTKDAKTFQLEAGTYYFQETKAPDDYEKVDTEIKFTVSNTGVVTVEDATGSVEKNADGTIVLKNKPVPAKYDVAISKTDMNGTALAGATIVLKDKDKNTIDSWTSTKNAKSLKLEAGTYYFQETAAPDDYEKFDTEIEFTVSDTGAVTVVTVVESGKVVKADDKTIVLKNAPKQQPEPTKYDVAISKTDLGGTALAGAVIALSKKGGAEIATWTSTTEAQKFKLEAGTYVFHETAAPTNYEKVETEIEFTVSDTGAVTVVTVSESVGQNADGTIVLKNAPVQQGEPTKYDVKISKTDLNGTALAGATIVLSKKEGETLSDISTWTSSTTAESFKLEEGTYVFQETAAPTGYQKVETAIEFTVDSTGNVEIVTASGSVEKNADGTIILKDAPKKYDVYISKTDLNGTAVEGATIVLKKDGVKKDEWESTKDAKKLSLEAGTYTFQETVAPTDYEKVDTEIEFTVSIEGKVTVNSASGSVEQKADGTIVLKNEPKTQPAPETFDVYISKTDLNGTAVEGATIVLKKDGVKQAEWESTKDAKKFSLEAGTYTFQETVAPTGYEKVNTEIEFTVDSAGKVTVTTISGSVEQKDDGTIVLKDAPKKYDVYISKTDLNGTAVEGATIVLKKDGVKQEEWESTKDAKKFSLEAGTYTFQETVAPTGFEKVNSEIEFTVDNAGKVTVTTISGSVEQKDDGTIVLKDAPKKYDVYISKTDLNGTAVEGATIVLKKDGVKQAEWESTKDAKKFSLEAGTYTFQETVAPTGYEKVETEIEFTVDNAGKVTVTTVSGRVEQKDDGTIVLKNAPEAPKADVTISKQTVSGAELEGAILTISVADGAAPVDLSNVKLDLGEGAVDKSNDSVISWMSGSKPTAVKGLPDGDYVLTETTAPEGYEKAESISFTVVGGTLYVGNESTEVIVMVDAYAPVKVSLKAMKFYLDSKDDTIKLKGNDFLFSLKGNGVDKTAKNDENGNVVFDEISYTQTGTYSYTITEVPGEETGVTYSEASYTAEVTITAGANGLESSVVYSLGIAPMTNALFINRKATEPDKTTVDISKKAGTKDGAELKGATLTLTGVDESDNEVIFTISDVTLGTDAQLKTTEPGTELKWISGTTPTTVMNLPNGTYTLHEVTAPDANGFEVASDIIFILKDGVVYDKDNKEIDNSTIVMVDEYKPVYVTLEAKKRYVDDKGYEVALKGNDFLFELDKDGTEVETKKNDSDGEVVFGELPFTKAGTYTYTIYEIPGEELGVSYSEEIYTAVVSITEGANGLESSVSYKKGTTPVASAKFTNIKATEEPGVPTGKLIITKQFGGDFTEEDKDTISFEVTNPMGITTSYSLIGEGENVFTYDEESKTYRLEIDVVGALLMGDFTITEVNSNPRTDVDIRVSYKINAGKAAIGDTAIAEVKDGKNTLVAFTNDYKKKEPVKPVVPDEPEAKQGTLVITKTFGGPVVEADKKTLCFVVTNTKTGTSETYKLSDFTEKGGVYTLELTIGEDELGDFTITEKNYNESSKAAVVVSYRVDGGAKVVKETAGVTVEDGKTTTVAFNNEYPEPKTEETGKISVHVTEESSGLDVPEAKVVITGEDGTTRTYVTNEYGEIVDENGNTPEVPAGKYTVTVSEVPTGYDVKVGEIGEVVVPKDGEGHHDAVIATEKGAIIITVLDEDTEEPVSNAEIVVIGPDGEKVTFITDENGQVTEYAEKDEFGNYVADVGEYTYTVVKVPEGYHVTVGETQTGEVVEGELTELEAKIAPSTGGLDIKVVDAVTGEPVPGATVEVVYPDGSTHTFITDENGMITELVKTDEKGRYTAATGEYRIRVIKVPEGYTVITGETTIETIDVDQVKHHVAKIVTDDSSSRRPARERTAQTGDDTPITMLFILMILSAGGFAGVVVKKKKTAKKK